MSPFTPDTPSTPGAPITPTTPSLHKALTLGATPPAHVIPRKIPAPPLPRTHVDFAGFHADTAYHPIAQPADHHARRVNVAMHTATTPSFISPPAPIPADFNIDFGDGGADFGNSGTPYDFEQPSTSNKVSEEQPHLHHTLHNLMLQS